MEDQAVIPQLLLEVTPKDLPIFTTLLQSGIKVKTTSSISLGDFLLSFEGFTVEYLSDTVQTIFLDGTAIDDLTTPLIADNTVVALSASMPGLAGAIFRKNSIHSPLRTITGAKESEKNTKEDIAVILKLFNKIARDKGADLLKSGVCIKPESLLNFLTNRKGIDSSIQGAKWQSNSINLEEMRRTISNFSRIQVQIQVSND